MARPPAYQLGRIGVRRRDKSDAGVGRRETGAGLLADKKSRSTPLVLATHPSDESDQAPSVSLWAPGCSVDHMGTRSRTSGRLPHSWSSLRVPRDA